MYSRKINQKKDFRMTFVNHYTATFQRTIKRQNAMPLLLRQSDFSHHSNSNVVSLKKLKEHSQVTYISKLKVSLSQSW